MDIERLKQTTRTTIDELERAAREHAELAREQYEEISERHGDPLGRIEEAVREPVEDTKRQVLALSADVNERTQHFALKVTEQTGQVSQLVNAEAQRLGHELDERTREVRGLIRARFGSPEIEASPVAETVDERPAGTAPGDETVEDQTEASQSSENEGGADASEGTSEGDGASAGDETETADDEESRDESAS